MRGQQGQTITEYALIIAGLGALLAVSLLFLAGKVSDVFHHSVPQQHPLRPPPSAVCDPSYVGACIPPPPPYLTCDDIRAMGFGVVRVVGSDPQHLDPDHDGIACD